LLAFFTYVLIFLLDNKVRKEKIKRSHAGPTRASNDQLAHFPWFRRILSASGSGSLVYVTNTGEDASNISHSDRDSISIVATYGESVRDLNRASSVAEAGIKKETETVSCKTGEFVGLHSPATRVIRVQRSNKEQGTSTPITSLGIESISEQFPDQDNL
jgi:hypothetical protein